MTCSRLAALACALIACLAVPAAAHADITVGEDLSLRNADKSAGKNTQVDLHASFSTDDPLKDLVVHLPPGLVGNPQAVAKCSQAQFTSDPSGCPADSKVGTTTVTTTLTPASGDVYNLVPSPGEPARLGASVMNGQIKQQVAVVLRADGGLDTIIRDFPNRDPELGILALAVKALDLSLDKRFMANPSSCGTATASVEATAYSGARGSRSTTYTTDNCGALPYAPVIAATLGATGPKGKERKPALTTVISVPAGHAATRTTVVTLPERMGVDVAGLGGVCSLEQQAADACPEAARIGTVQARTPLLDAPLSGPVYMAQVQGQLLPGLRLVLNGQVKLRLNGTIDLTGQAMRTAFDGIPDTPLARLELTFAAGGPLRVIGDPCTGTVLRLSAAMTGHNGAQVTAPARVLMAGCPITAGARLSPRKRPALRLVVRKGRDAVALRQVLIALPRGLRAVARKGARVTADGRVLARQDVQLSARTITIHAGSAKTVTVRLARGAVRGRPRGAFAIEGVRTDDQRSTTRVRAARPR
jgi:hypothetical protein